jgi:phosphoribosylanthranilate isomerase
VGEVAVEIKICGLTRPEDALVAAEIGASYVGAIFAGGPRRITPERAAGLFEAIPGDVRRVGVFGAESPAEVARMARVAGLDIVQLHADPDAAHAKRVHEESGTVVWAVVRVSADSNSLRVAELDAAVDAIVLDAFVPGQLGGTGTSFDWRRPAAWARPGHARLIVSGGLDAGNVGDAMQWLAPDVVDVSSGVEAAPGIKDHEKMRAFVQAAHRGDYRR